VALKSRFEPATGMGARTCRRAWN